jgi:hypothetical protein
MRSRARSLRWYLPHAEPQAVVTTEVRDRFLADHRKLEARLERMVVTLAANDLEGSALLWSEFDSGLRMHLEAEESTMIPELLGAHARDARVLIQEHQHIRTRLMELGGAVESPRRLGRLRSFLDELRAHARTEDRLLYQWVDALLDEPTRLSLVDALSRAPAA